MASNLQQFSLPPGTSAPSGFTIGDGSGNIIFSYNGIGSLLVVGTSAGSMAQLQILCGPGVSMIINADGSILYGTPGGEVIIRDTTGLWDGESIRLPNGGSFQDINQVPVVGIQQPAIADATGVLLDDTNKINAILAALRAHGLIAT